MESSKKKKILKIFKKSEKIQQNLIVLNFLKNVNKIRKKIQNSKKNGKQKVASFFFSFQIF